MDREDKKALVKMAEIEFCAPPGPEDPPDYGSVREMVEAMVAHPTAHFVYDESIAVIQRLRMAFRDTTTGTGWALPLTQVKLDSAGNDLVRTPRARAALLRTLNSGGSPYTS